jgi:ABC-2 type transport system permease protein
MSVMTAAPRAVTRGSALWQLTITELKLYLRERVGPVWGVGFPMLLLIILASIPAYSKPRTDLSGLTHLDIEVPILIMMAVTLISIIAMPYTLAGYRERGILRRMQTTPAGPLRVLAAQLIVSLSTIIVTMILLLAVGRFGYGATLPHQVGGWVIAMLLTVAAMLGLGLFVAAVAPGVRAAMGIGNLLFFPMMFFSGLWLPVPDMPMVLQHISHATPLGAAYGALQNATLGQWPTWLQLVTLAAYAVAFGLAAARLFRWE